jgi:hypothetical protein
VADLFSLLVGGVCLGLFVLASLPNIRATRSLWAGYRSLALLLCWLTAGPLVAVAVAVIGSAVGASLHPAADRLSALRRITLSGCGAAGRSRAADAARRHDPAARTDS